MFQTKVIIVMIQNISRNNNF